MHIFVKTAQKRLGLKQLEFYLEKYLAQDATIKLSELQGRSNFLNTF